MKRYTAIISCELEDLEGLRRQVDRELSRQLLTYRLGAVARRGPSEVLIEVATEMERGDLRRLIESAGAKLDFDVVQVGWGWLVTPDPQPGPNEPDPTFPNPLIAIQPRLENPVEYGLKLAPLLLFFLRLGLMAVAIYLFVSTLDHLLDGTQIVAVALYLLSTLLPRGRFSRVSALSLDERGLQIRKWLPRSSRRIDWQEVDGLDLVFMEPQCTVLAGGKRTSITLSALRDNTAWREIARTIVDRADLLFVGSISFNNASYRRFEAE